MGLLKPTLSVSGSSGAMEVAIIHRHDENQEIALINYDDVMGELLFRDNNGDGIGERTFPFVEVAVKCKVKFSTFDMQDNDATGNTPTSNMAITMFEDDLKALGLLTNGVLILKPNDRLIRIESLAGDVRVDLTSGGRDGLRCYEVVPGETGSRIYIAMFEARKVA